MNKKLKDIGAGASVAGVTIIASSNIIPGISGCTGACGACGLTCLAPIVGISSILLIAITKKIKIEK